MANSIAELIRAAQKGDKTAIQTLYRQYEGLIINCSKTYGWFDEDLKQELSAVFCELVYAFKLPKSETHSKRDFTKAVSLRLQSRKIDYIKSLSRRSQNEISSSPDSELFFNVVDETAGFEIDAVLASVGQFEDIRLIDGFKRLNEKQKKILIQNAVEGRRQSEIASELGIGVKAVEQTIRRAKDKFQ